MLADDAAGAVRLCPGEVTVERGQIVRVDEQPDLVLPPDAPVVMPGFIDAHVHLPQFDSIGVQGLELLEWLSRVIFPAEARWADVEFAERMSRRVFGRLRAAGTTGFAAYATSHHAATRRAMEVAAEMGFRGVIGQALMDREAAPELIGTPWQEQLEQVASLRPTDRIEPSVTPRFAVACTPELLEGAGRLAQETGWCVQTHLSETRAELAAVHRLFGATPYVQVYRDAGLLSRRSVLAHGIWLDAADRAMVAGAEAVIAHCPTANLFLESGAMDLHALRESGVRMALGSDIAGGYERSMPRVARAMLETVLQRRMRLQAEDPALPLPACPTPGQAFYAITGGNADALGWTQTGRLREGCDADLVLVRPDMPFRESPDPLGTLLWGWSDRWVERVWVGGRETARMG